MFNVALDWTANTNHSGFFVAKHRGFYEEAGFDVSLMTPDNDNYAVTPAKKVELGLADVALCPFESIISYNTKSTPFDAVAIAAIFREDISAITVLESSDIKSPKDLDGKGYASYKARYEDHIVTEMVKNDGGKGTLQLAYPEKLGIWETLLSGRYDATWIFTNWEGVHAEAKAIELRSFKMADYGIPYSYSPVIMADKSKVQNNKAQYRAFLEATKKGFLYAQEHPKVAVSCIKPFVAANDHDIDLLKSQRFTNPFYGDALNWGLLERSNVDRFLNWLRRQGLENTPLSYQDLVFPGLL